MKHNVKPLYVRALAILTLILSGCNSELDIQPKNTELKTGLSICEEINGTTYYSKDFLIDVFPVNQHHWSILFLDGHVMYNFRSTKASSEDFTSRGTYSCVGGVMSITNEQGIQVEQSFSDDLRHFSTSPPGGEELAFIKEDPDAIESKKCITDVLYKTYLNTSSEFKVFVAFSGKGRVILNTGRGDSDVTGKYECETGVLHIHLDEEDQNLDEGSDHSYTLKLKEDVLLLMSGDSIITLEDTNNLTHFDSGVCLASYAPICAIKPVACDGGLCGEGEYVSYESRCQANAEGAAYRFEGDCGVLSGTEFRKDRVFGAGRKKIADLEIPDGSFRKCIESLTTAENENIYLECVESRSMQIHEHGLGLLVGESPPPLTVKKCEKTRVTYADEVTSLECKDVKSVQGVEYLTSLTDFTLSAKHYRVDLSKASALQTLHLMSGVNNNTAVDLPKNSSLKSLTLNSVSGEYLDLSSSLSLEELHVSGSGSIVDISHNTKLKVLSINNNSLSHFDLSAGGALQKVSIVGVNVKSLTLADGVPLKDLEVLRFKSVFDEHDKSAGIHSVKNANFNEFMHLDYNSIPTLESLSLQHAHRTLDLSNLSQLKTLRSHGPLEELLLADGVLLTTLDIWDSLLPSIDLLDQTDLSTIYIKTDLLRELNLEGLNKIVNIHINSLELDDLKFHSPINLMSLNLEAPKLTFLDVSDHVMIKDLNVLKTGINSLDLSSHLKLQNLTVPSSVRILNVSNTSLSSLDVNSKNLTELVAKNTSIKKLTLATPNLIKIDLHGSSLMEAVRIGKNELLDLNLSTLVNLSYLKLGSSYLSDLGFSPLVGLEQLYVGKSNVETLDLLNQNKLRALSLSGPKLSSVELPFNDKLTAINLSHLGEGVSFSSGSSVYSVSIADSDSAGLIDFSGLDKLRSLNISKSNISKLNLLSNAELKSVRIEESSLGDLDLSSNVELASLSIKGATFPNLDFSFHAELTKLTIERASFPVLDFSSLVKLEDLTLSSITLPALDLSNNTQIKKVHIFQPSFSCDDVVGGEMLASRLNKRYTCSY